MNTLIQEIKGLQDFTFSLQKTLKEHAENSQYLLSKINKTEGIAGKNAGDIYNLKIKEGLHSDLLDRAKPIIDIANPLSKVAFRIQKLETSLQKVTKDFNPQELKERQEVNANCITDLQTDFLLHGQMLADLRLEIEKVKQLQALHDKQIHALKHEASKSVWEGKNCLSVGVCLWTLLSELSIFVQVITYQVTPFTKISTTLKITQNTSRFKVSSLQLKQTGRFVIKAQTSFYLQS